MIGGLRSVDFEARAVWLNRSAARIDIGGQFTAAVSLALDNGRITHIYAINNPQAGWARRPRCDHLS